MLMGIDLYLFYTFLWKGVHHFLKICLGSDASEQQNIWDNGPWSQNRCSGAHCRHVEPQDPQNDDMEFLIVKKQLRGSEPQLIDSIRLINF